MIQIGRDVRLQFNMAAQILSDIFTSVILSPDTNKQGLASCNKQLDLEVRACHEKLFSSVGLGLW